MKTILLMVVALLVAGCATADKLNAVQLGMSEADVIGILGSPKSTSAQGSTEYMNYDFYDHKNNVGFPVPHFVRLIDGRVESFGKTGDFDSTKVDSVRIETDENIKVNGESDLYTELRKLKALLDEGVLTDDEYDALKKEAIQKY